MGDRLISLSAAIDAVHKNYDTILDFTSDGKTISYSIEDILSELPSAQPEIIRCKDCRYNNDCEIQYSAQSADEFFCGCAERKDNE